MRKSSIRTVCAAMTLAAASLSGYAVAGQGPGNMTYPMHPMPMQPPMWARPGMQYGMPLPMAQPTPPRLGIGVAPLSGDELDTLGIEYGVRITGVQPGTAAETAGLQPGDVVTGIGERPAYSPRRLARLIDYAPDSVDISVLRDGEQLTLQAELGPAATAPAYLGVRVQPMTPELKEAFGAEGNLGVLVSQVVPDSAAAQAGIKAGDVLVRVGDQPVASPPELIAAIDGYRAEQAVEVEILRDRELQKHEVTLGERPRISMPHGAHQGMHGYRKHGQGMRGHGCHYGKPHACPMMKHKAKYGLRYS
jgi:membrane-associated protease RseP (regulator of RpoE activity)